MLHYAEIHCTDAANRPIATDGPDEAALHDAVFATLARSPLCAIATVGADEAHVNTAYFSYSAALELFFLSHPESLHCRNLSQNGSMAMAVYASDQPWDSPGQGLQLFGTGVEATGRVAHEAETSYGTRFEAFWRWRATLDPASAARDYRFYRFEVAVVKILDEKLFGDAAWVVASVQRS